MIGYSNQARSRYHKERGFLGWAKCHLIPMDVRVQDELLGMAEAEAILQEGNSYLSRCPKCWGVA